MDLKQIKELMAAMEKAKLKRVQVKTEKGFEILLEKDGYEPPHLGAHTIHHHPTSHHFPHHAPPPSRPGTEEHQAFEKAAFTQEAEICVTSPMVGTFYASPSPEDPPFVKVGDRVTEDTVVCIIEAMKVMNEVKAGVKGKVAEILVENGHPVEFGTKIIRIA